MHRDRVRIWKLLVTSLLVVVSAAATNAAEKKPLVDDWAPGELFEFMGNQVIANATQTEVSEFAFHANFRFSHDAIWRDPVNDQDPRQNQIFGIDVSHHTTDSCHCVINWTKLADQKVAFAYLKASQGNDYFDPKFGAYLTGIRALPANKRIEVGAYHFLSADGDGADQADNYLQVVDGKIGVDDLLPVVDLEWDVRVSHGAVIVGPDGKPKDFWKGTPGATILKRTRDWLDAVKAKTNKEPLVYTNATWWKERIGPIDQIESSLAPYRVWISDLSSKGLKVEAPFVYKGHWHLWQFTFTAVADQGGLPAAGRVDANVFEAASLEGLKN